MLSKRQIARLTKAKRSGVGSDIKISKAQIRKVIQHGGSLWSSLFSLGTRMLPYAGRAVAKVAPPLATGALSALGSLDIDKLFGKKQTGGFLVPQSKIDQLIKYKSLSVDKETEGRHSCCSAVWFRCSYETNSETVWGVPWYTLWQVLVFHYF